MDGSWIIFWVNANSSVPVLSPEPKQSITNGLPHVDSPPTPGQQMAEKMRPSRQDHGDGDAGQGLTLASTCVLDWACSLVLCCVVLLQLRRERRRSPSASPASCLTLRS